MRSEHLKQPYPQTFAEFFAGIGLMRMGLERQGWAVEFANDIDPLKHQMYRAHFGPDRHFICEDIYKLTADNLPDVALATASFPCTDLSLAGARRGLDGAQSSAYWGFVQCLALWGSRKPPVVLLENVPGFLTSNNGQDFRDAALSLNSLGYVVDAFVLDAAYFVPQSRQRLFMVGTLRSAFPTARLRVDHLVVTSSVRPKAVVDYIQANRDIAWRVRPLPQPVRIATHVADIIDKTDHVLQEWWSDERVAYLLNQMSIAHRATAQQMIDAQEWSYGTVFRRVRNHRSMAELRTDGVAGCLRTPKGGSGRQILFKAGFGHVHVRLLSPSECARLMGADGFTVNVPMNQALFGFGDAVCVPVIEWIAMNYLSPLISELNTPTLRPRRSKRTVERALLYA